VAGSTMPGWPTPTGPVLPQRSPSGTVAIGSSQTSNLDGNKEPKKQAEVGNARTREIKGSRRPGRGSGPDTIELYSFLLLSDRDQWLGPRCRACRRQLGPCHPRGPLR